jgi:hypothetical protein
MPHTPTSILEGCRNGECLAKTITRNRAGNPMVSFCLEPSGTHVTEGQATVGDGLLGFESSQTWRLKGVTTNLESR